MYHKPLVFVTYVSDMFCTAGYNACRRYVLEGKTPDQVVAERRTAKPALAKDKPAGQASSCDITKARLIADRAKEVSQPDTFLQPESCLWKAGLVPVSPPARGRQVVTLHQQPEPDEDCKDCTSTVLSSDTVLAAFSGLDFSGSQPPLLRPSHKNHE